MLMMMDDMERIDGKIVLRPGRAQWRARLLSIANNRYVLLLAQTLAVAARVALQIGIAAFAFLFLVHARDGVEIRELAYLLNAAILLFLVVLCSKSVLYIKLLRRTRTP